MDEDEPGRRDEGWIRPLEHELSMHLERADLLGRRAKLSNAAAREEIGRAKELADRLSGRPKPR
jgi:hypothetical protein